MSHPGMNAIFQFVGIMFLQRPLREHAARPPAVILASLAKFVPSSFRRMLERCCSQVERTSPHTRFSSSCKSQVSSEGSHMVRRLTKSSSQNLQALGKHGRPQLAHQGLPPFPALYHTTATLIATWPTWPSEAKCRRSTCIAVSFYICSRRAKADRKI